MIRTRLPAWLVVAFAGVAVLAGINVVEPFVSDIVIPLHLAQLAAAVIATVFCWRVANRLDGVERAWRRLMTLGMAGWAVGQAFCGWYRIVDHTWLPSPSLADVGFLMLPAFALPALLMLTCDRHGPVTAGQRRRRLVLVLDALMIVGSLFVLTWWTALGSVVHAGAATPQAFAVAIAYPATDLILVVIIVLLTATRQVPHQYRLQLGLLGIGLTALAASDSAFAYLFSSGAQAMPTLANAGFVAGPALVAAAAVATAKQQPPAGHPRMDRAAEWLYLLLPYVPVAGTGVLLVIHTVTGSAADGVEIGVGWVVIGLVVIRQMITLVENTVLLERVSEGQRRLAHQAYHDPLTGLANRALFHERLLRAMERHRVDGDPVAVLFVDLDDFKLINDSLGHIAGDGLLRAIGERLRGCVRGADAVARLGGDEFAVLVEGEVEAPERVGEVLLAALRRPFAVNGLLLSVGASVGVATTQREEPTPTPDALLRRADTAMYSGKRRGKGIVVCYRPTGRDGPGDPDLPNLLASALRGDPAAAGFEVHYQPIVRLDDATVVAVEALARWSHPYVGQVEPDVFVAIAERAGVIAALDDFVLARACADAAALADGYGADIDVHVNVSASRLGQPELEVAVGRVLDQHPSLAGRLILEITETSRIGDLSRAAAASRRLRERGVRLALDDFGAGFNALAQLHALPVDIVKLDRAITAVKGDHQRTKALCSSILDICAGLKVSVIAEGVETVSQAGALAGFGCHLGQGYLYGPPAPLRDLRPAASGLRAAT